MNYSVSHFLIREKNKLVKHPLISKRAFRDAVFLWNTVDEESVIRVSAGTLKQVHLIFMWKPYDSTIFHRFYKFQKCMVSKLHCCFNLAPPFRHGCFTLTIHRIFNFCSSSNISASCSLNLSSWGFFPWKICYKTKSFFSQLEKTH